MADRRRDAHHPGLDDQPVNHRSAPAPRHARTWHELLSLLDERRHRLPEPRQVYVVCAAIADNVYGDPPVERSSQGAPVHSGPWDPDEAGVVLRRELELLGWTFDEDDWENFWRAYLVGIQHVSEILDCQGVPWTSPVALETP